jgi:hypothetical protein
MSFAASLFGGSNPTINKQIDQLGNFAGSTMQTGFNDTNAASNFFNSLLQGGGATSKVLAPQVRAIQNQTQQQKQTASQFGNRSGGTNSQMQMADSTGRAAYNDLVSSLLGTSANSLAGIGSNLLNTSLTGYQQQLNASQQQMQNWQNSIFGKGIAGGIGAIEGFGLGTGFNALSPSTFSTMFGGH